MFLRVIIACTLLEAWPVLAADQPKDLPWKVNPPIVTVKKELFAKHPRPGAAALASDGYVGPKLERLEYHGLEIIDDAPEDNGFRFSSDNGRSWVPVESTPDTSPEVQGLGGGPVVFDPNAGVLVGIFMRQIFSGANANNFLYTRFSRDYGKSWSKPRQLRYEPGEDFDPKNPLKPGFLLRNQAYRGSSILLRRDGTLVHAAGMVNAPHDPENDQRPYRMGGVCFIGKWDAKAADFSWKAGRRVEVSPDLSWRGLMEPEVAELRDKRLLVVWRGSDTAKTAGHKWYSVSEDGGMTLSEPAEWKYDDGSHFYSPSAWHLMIRHSVTGRLYWVGNICPEPPDGNWPRYPLVIAEVDEKISALKRSTVTAIDDREPGQKGNVQFSNFSLMENRETHELELLMTLYGALDPANVRTADCYKYILKLK